MKSGYRPGCRAGKYEQFGRARHVRLGAPIEPGLSREPGVERKERAREIVEDRDRGFGANVRRVIKEVGSNDDLAASLTQLEHIPADAVTRYLHTGAVTLGTLGWTRRDRYP